MFCSDIVVADLPRFIIRQIDDAFRTRRQLHVLEHLPVAPPYLPLDLRAYTPQRDAHPIEDARRDAVVLAYHSEQQVLCRDVSLA